VLNVKRILCTALISGLCVFGVSAGGGTEGAAKSDTVRFRVATWDAKIETYIEQCAKILKEKNPKVSYEVIDILAAEYVDKITVMLAGGDDFDVLPSKNNPMYLNMVTNKQIIDVMPYVNRDKMDLAMFGGAAERITFDKKVYGLPYRSDIWLLYYNKDLFDAAKEPYPSDNMTWEEYAALCRRMTSGRGSDKVYGGLFHFWPACVQNLGVQDGRNTVIAKDFSFMAPYYRAVLALQKEGAILNYSTIKTGNQHYSGIFYNGRVATVYQGTWFTGQILKQMKTEGLKFKWGMAKAPHPANVKEGYVVGTAFPICINAKSKNPDLAWEYIKLLSGKDGAGYVVSAGYLPAYQDDAILAKYTSLEGFPPNSKSALGVTNLVFEVPVHAKSGVIGKILGEEHDLMMTESISVEQGIQNLNKRVAAALAE
jgi:multiple sugar transport system substrate-binding protein